MLQVADPREITLPLHKSDLDEALDASSRSLSCLLDKTILVTGASGFVGSWLSEVLIHAYLELGGGGRLILLNRKATQRQRAISEKLENVEILEGDVRERLLLSGELDLIVHAATTTSQKLNTTAPLEMRSVVLDGMERVIDLSIRNGCRLVNLSSGAVYGLAQVGEECFSEERIIVRDQLINGSSYHGSKIEAEKMLMQAHESEGLNFVNTRLFAFLAPLLPIDQHFAAGNFIRDALLHDFIGVSGNGDAVRSYLYGTDLVAWLLEIAAFGRSGESYNVGSPYPLSIRELANRVALASNKKVRFAEQEMMGNSIYVPCFGKCQSELGLKVGVEVGQAIERTLSWWSRVINLEENT